MVLYNSKKHAYLSQWQVINDEVMGGISQAEFKINEEGYGEFSGQVSLENNGGFSSVKYCMDRIDVDSFQKIRVKLKGDINRFQLRLKTNKDDRHSYVSYFETSGKKQIIEINFREFYPTYRGRNLQLSNYHGNHLEEIGFLIANKKTEKFKLEIESISLI